LDPYGRIKVVVSFFQNSFVGPPFFMAVEVLVEKVNLVGVGVFRQ
jgi:hypothetical protein